MKKPALGRHLLVEFYNCNPVILNDVRLIETLMNEAAVSCGATIVQSSFHRFQPHGVSGVVVIAESHLAIHTWPEYSYASVDLFTCGDSMDPMLAYNALKTALQAKAAEIQKINRGNLELIQKRLATASVTTVAPASPHRHSGNLAKTGGIGR